LKIIQKKRLHEIIFEADTLEGKIVNLLIIFLILANTVFIIIRTVPNIDNLYFEKYIPLIQWGIVFLFSIEYILRI